MVSATRKADIISKMSSINYFKDPR